MELLSPAGNLEKLKIAVSYGANAVYLAGQQFGLRRGADNFTHEELEKGVAYAHQKDTKVYLTLNSFLFTHEIKLLPEYIDFLKEIKIDAVICSDLGVVEVVQKHSDIPIHISTQTSVENSWHAKIWSDLGIKRIVVGRELSIEEAAKIKENTDLEVEMFVHGAMCMAYSGNCTISNYTAGRDSNRGGCIQNCRFLYDVKDQDGTEKPLFFMSSKDLQGIRQLPVFRKYNIDSLKIEGRMKSNLYIATTTKVYRDAMNRVTAGLDLDNFTNHLDELSKLPHRDYTEGSLLNKAGKDSIYHEHDAHSTGYEMAGTILEVNQEKSSFALHVRNRLQKGEEIEFLPCQGEVIHYKLSHMSNVAGKEVEIAQPNSILVLPFKDGLSHWNVARIKKK